jgi:hypothetical protein
MMVSRVKFKRWLIWAAESCGWLLDTDRLLVQRYLLSAATLPASRSGSSIDEALTIEQSSRISSFSDAHRRKIEIADEFLLSAASLLEDKATYGVILELLSRLEAEPYVARQVEDTNVFRVRSKSVVIDGVEVPPISVVYYLSDDDEQSIIVVGAFDENLMPNLKEFIHTRIAADN